MLYSFCKESMGALQNLSNGNPDQAKIRGYGLYENTNRKVALKLLPVKGLENMPHCSFLKK